MKTKQILFYGLIVLILFLAGIYLIGLSNNYELSGRVVKAINGNEIKDTTIYQIKPLYQFVAISGFILISTAFSILIGIVVVNTIARRDNNTFDKKLRMLQESTARETIDAVFKKMVNSDFLDIIKKDVVNQSFLQSNVKWNYDFTLNDRNNLQLRRTVSYRLENLGAEDHEEEFRASYQSSRYSNNTTIELRVCHEEDKSFSEVAIDKPITKDLFKSALKKILVRKNSFADLVFVMNQSFNSDYAFECQVARSGMVNLEINANFPEDYRFDIFLGGLSTEARLVTAVSGKKTYRIDGAIYKGQTVEFICERK